MVFPWGWGNGEMGVETLIKVNTGVLGRLVGQQTLPWSGRWGVSFRNGRKRFTVVEMIELGRSR